MAHVELDLTTPTPKDECGATATEYGVLVGFIALAIVFGVTAFGTAVNDLFNALANSVDGLIP
jgi:pilus assembly protein Flp/PilA